MKVSTRKPVSQSSGHNVVTFVPPRYTKGDEQLPAISIFSTIQLFSSNKRAAMSTADNVISLYYKHGKKQRHGKIKRANTISTSRLFENKETDINKPSTRLSTYSFNISWSQVTINITKWASNTQIVIPIQRE